VLAFSLLNKWHAYEPRLDYADGVVYEVIEFRAFQRPLNQIGVLYRDMSGLNDLALIRMLPVFLSLWCVGEHCPCDYCRQQGSARRPALRGGW
jgi:hypothetical protein